MLPPPVENGQMLAGKYRVERVLGQGGMGVVVAATHVQLDQRVAVKFLLPGAVVHPQAVQRFLREARAAVKIQSEFVARVIDVGTLEETGTPYMVMEYLQGEDLEGLLRERGPLPVDEAVEYVLQACTALAEAHSHGIIHRDLKPANLFRTLRSDGAPVVKVLDFGISKMTLGRDSAADASLTATSAVLGTPMYMSPEQIRSTRDVDHRTDIWALGSILQELLTGAQPFPGETMPSLFASILEAQPLPIRLARSDVPEDLEAAVHRCLQKDPDRRYANMAMLASALAPFGPPRSRDLAERAARVLGVDTALGAPEDRPNASASDSRSGVSKGSPTHGQTGVAWGATHSQTAPSKALIFSGLGIVAVGAVGVGLLTFLGGAERSGTPQTGSASVAPAALPPLDSARRTGPVKPEAERSQEQRPEAGASARAPAAGSASAKAAKEPASPARLEPAKPPPAAPQPKPQRPKPRPKPPPSNPPENPLSIELK